MPYTDVIHLTYKIVVYMLKENAGNTMGRSLKHELDIEGIIRRLKECLNVITDTELAEKVGTTARNVWQWKSTRKMSMDLLVDVCLTHDLDITYIINGKGSVIYEEEKRRSLHVISQIISILYNEQYSSVFSVLPAEKKKQLIIMIYEQTDENVDVKLVDSLIKLVS